MKGNEDRISLRYVQDPSKDPKVSGFLLMKDAIEINDYSMFRKGDVIP